MAKILIIGGGVAGLSAGIYARLSGHEAHVYEKHFLPGGNLTGWNRGEYHIDNCIHWLTGTNKNNPMYKMWVDLGILGDGIGIIQGDSLLSCDRDGKRVSLYCSLDRLRREMLLTSPEDKKEINRFCNAIELIMGFENTAGEEFNEGMTAGRLFRGIGPVLKYFGLTTGQLARRFKSPALQCFITGFWGDDFGAFALVYVFATYCGRNGALPEGGSVKSAERLAERFRSLGGNLHLKSEVVRIDLDNGVAKSITLADGSRVSGDYVVVTTDPKITFGRLLDAPMPKKLKKQYDNPKMRRFSAYHAAFACDSPELPFKGDLIFDVPEEHVQALGTKQLIVREFSHEPGFAPEGKNILQTMTFCFDDGAEEFVRLKKENPEAYGQKKKQLSELLRKLIEEHCPTLRGRLSLIDFWTPATYERFVGSQIGSFMSFAIPAKMLPIPIDGGVDGISNLLLATQWQQSPGGLPIAATQGRVAIEKINKIESKKK